MKFSGFEGVIDGLHLPDHGADAENKIKEKKKVTGEANIFLLSRDIEGGCEFSDYNVFGSGT